MFYVNYIFKAVDFDLNIYKNYLEKILIFLKIKDKEVSITLCGNVLIRKLNKQYRGKDQATDVLSFEQSELTLLGDIFISLPTARANCRYFKTNLMEEVILLTVHGLLHLLGYDHQTPKEEKIMQNKEQQIMCKFFKKEYYAKKI